MDGTLIGTTTPNQSEPENNDNEVVSHTPQNWRFNYKTQFSAKLFL